MLRVENLHSGYGNVEILHGVNLVVPPGSTVALLGPNGAGKTTLLKALAGLLPVREGRVILDGEQINKDRTSVRTRAGMCLLPEGRGIFRQLSVKQNLAMFASGKNVDAAIDQTASFFPVLAQRLSQQAGTLSGGQQQMLALARALVTTPKVVLADELSVGLAPVIVDQIFEALEAMKAKGQALLIVEQYVHRVLEVADYVYILHKGSVVFVGEPDQCRDGVVFEHFLGSVA